MTQDTLSNLYGIRRQCIGSIQQAEARGEWAEAKGYRDELGKLNSLIEGMGVNRDSWVAADREEAQVKLSARNQIPGTVIEVHVGAVNATIKATSVAAISSLHPSRTKPSRNSLWRSAIRLR